MRYPAEEREVLRALLGLQQDKTFMWLLEQMRTERAFVEANVLHTIPSDQLTMNVREQNIGYARGLRRFEALVSEHTNRLKEMMKHE